MKQQENVSVPKQDICKKLIELIETGKSIFVDKPIIEYLEIIATSKDGGYYKEYSCGEVSISVLQGDGKWQYLIPETRPHLDVIVHVVLEE